MLWRFPFDLAELGGLGGCRRALEAKAATDTVLLKASSSVLDNQSALRVITSLTMMGIILLLLFTEGATIAMVRLLGSCFGRHYSPTPRSNLEFPITLMRMFGSVGGN